MDVGPIKRREHRILNSYTPNQWKECHSLVLYLSLGPQTSLIKLLIYIKLMIIIGSYRLTQGKIDYCDWNYPCWYTVFKETTHIFEWKKYMS